MAATVRIKIERTREVGDDIGSAAASRDSEAASSTLPDLKIFHNTGWRLYLG